MGSGKLYTQPTNTNKNAKRSRFTRGFFFAGMLLLSMPLVSKATNTPPTYTGPSTQIYSICQNAVSGDFTSLLTVNDPDAGDVETWSVGVSPAHGSLSGFNTVAIATGGPVGPSTSVTYTPNSGYSGADQFTVIVSDGNGGTAIDTINVAVSALPTITFPTGPIVVCSGATNATLNYSAESNLGPTSQTFPFTNSTQTWTVPPGVTSIAFDVQGATGGSDDYSGAPNPGNGGRIQGTINVTPGATMYVNVGGAGGNGTVSGGTGGFNGGGNANYYFYGSGGGGGGASDVRLGGSALSNRVIVAGGGGGNGWDTPGPTAGGDGGGLIGQASGNNVYGSHAAGGTQLNGGAGAIYPPTWTPGSPGASAVGGNGSVSGISGGGGGGYYGGGGGVWTGGGGGSSFASSVYTTGVTNTPGYNSIGNGAVSFNYIVPATYTITFDATALAAGFVNVPATAFPSSPLNIAVPAGAAPGTYNAFLSVSNPTCQSQQYPIQIQINPLPVMDPTPVDSICNTTLNSEIDFNSTIPGTTYTWTNSNSSIGLATSGTGSILPFVATDTTNGFYTANIIVTPTAAGCAGATDNFSIVVKPTPTLTSSLTPPDICDSTMFVYNPTSGVTGTTFTWFHSLPVGVTSNLIGSVSGAGSPNEYLDDTTNTTQTVTYLYTLSANSCTNNQNVVVNVYPNPTLNISLTPSAICDGSIFLYPAGTSVTSPATHIAWTRAVQYGISDSATSNTGSVNERLHDTTSAPVAVNYIYSLSLTGTSTTCPANMQTVTVTVNPSPVLNSGLTFAPVCDNQHIYYPAGSSSTGVSLSWTRPVVPGISNGIGSGSGDILDSLHNTTDSSIIVTYIYTLNLTGTSCSNNQAVMVTINPTPKLSSALTGSVCNNTPLSYVATSGTTGTTFTWTRDTVTGISNATNTGVGNPTESLINTTSNPVVAPYVFALSANSCQDTQTVNITVNPTLLLSSSLTPPTICDSTVFNYTPTSATTGVTFNWFQPYVPGIYSLQQSGTGNPMQELINSTNGTVVVTYMYTLGYGACSDSQAVSVVVNPTPKLTSPMTGEVCSNYPFTYTPASYTLGATFAWDRPLVAGITPNTGFASAGAGIIHETLTNSTSAPIYVTYYYRLGIGACTNLYTQSLRVAVNPTPGDATIVTHPLTSTLCSGTMYQTFGIASPAPGIDYHWTATNGTVYQEGNNGQYALVDFMTPGTATVTVQSNYAGYDGCIANGSYSETITSGASVAAPGVIYVNGQFICLLNENSSYQWGYDNAITLQPTTLTGEINQDYNNSNPDFNLYNYWVMVTTGDCTQKAYYNAPAAVTDVNGATDVKVFPNPANDVVNVEINTTVGGNMQVEMYNMLGQKVDTKAVVNNKASFNVTSLPAGCYIIDCFREGVKITSTRFIKN